MDKALASAGADSFDARLAESRAKSRIRGLGFASYIEVCAFGNSEPAKAVLEADGTVSVHIGTQSNGQGHQTAYAQFVAGPLGLDYDRIRVVQGDTDALEKGGGTGGSRSIPLGVALGRPRLAAPRRPDQGARRRRAGGGHGRHRADRRHGARGRHRPRRLLCRHRQKGAGQEQADGRAASSRRRSTPTRTARMSARSRSTRRPARTEIVDYTIVDDFGATVNPMLLAGQIHGGVAQGIGQALLEHTVYDEDGQLITATFNDYTMPRAWDMPSFSFQTRNVPCKWNELGIKGAGEAGTIGAAPAVMNARGRRAPPRLRHRPHRHAGHAAAGLGDDPGRPPLKAAWPARFAARTLSAAAPACASLRRRAA